MARLLRAPFQLRRLVTPFPSLLYRRRYSTQVGPESFVPGHNTPATTTVTPEIDPPSRNQTPESSKTAGEWTSFRMEETALRVTTTGSKFSVIRYPVLRDACKCPQCVDVHSKQRNFRTSDIDPFIRARELKWDGESLQVTWDNDIPDLGRDHVSTFTLDQLLTPSEHHRRVDGFSNRGRQLWGKERMQAQQHWITFEEYMQDGKPFARAMRELARVGLLFVKDIPDSREMVEKIGQRMGPIRNTFYGSSWDVRKVPEAKNVAYTSQFLGFHMDLMYMNEPPGFQLLHCLRNSCEGGESLFADTFKVANDMFTSSRTEYETLAETWLNYEYLHKDHAYSNSWPVFETQKLRHGKRPIVHVNYSPPFQAPLGYLKRKSPGEIKAKLAALKSFAHRLEEEKNIFELKLKPGECVIFENRRIVHARRQFNTAEGERWLAGTYVDEDAVISRWRTLRAQDPTTWKTGDLGSSELEDPNKQ